MEENVAHPLSPPLTSPWLLRHHPDLGLPLHTMFSWWDVCIQTAPFYKDPSDWVRGPLQYDLPVPGVEPGVSSISCIGRWAVYHEHREES